MNIIRNLFLSLIISATLVACTTPIVLPEGAPFATSQPEEEANPTPQVADNSATVEEAPSTAAGTTDLSGAESSSTPQVVAENNSTAVPEVATDSATDVATSVAADASQVASSEPVMDAFVRREGSTLMLNDAPFTFFGTNAFFLQPEMVYGKKQAVEETLDKAVELGFNVIRMWGFNDSPLSVDPAAIQIGPGEFNEGSLMALDRVVAMAKERQLRVILPLVNNWEDYGGIPRYLEWCECNAQHSDFYTNETIKALYRGYVEMLLTRVNTETGIAYRDEPAILAWELANELRDRGNDATALLAWHQEMATFIKALDPNHLIADGGEGFDDNPALYPDLGNTYPVRGSEGATYHRLVAIPEIDMVSYHLYPEHWDLNPINDAAVWIRSHEAIAKQAGKVAYMGEFGLASPDVARATMYQNWINTALREAQSSGLLVWNLVYDLRPNSDGFGIYCPADVETCTVLQR